MDISPSNCRVVIHLDDNESLSASLSDLLQSRDYRALCFSTALDLLNALPSILKRENEVHVGLFDMRLSGEMTGMDVFHRVRQLTTMPIIFLSGESRVSEAISALKSGAYDFLLKPFDVMDLLRKIEEAFESQSRIQKVPVTGYPAHQNILGQLTRREREVLDYVLIGHRGKDIADALSISERTVKMHRSNAMRKMNARNLAHLATLYQHYLESAPKERGSRKS